MRLNSTHAESSRELMRGPRTDAPSYSTIHKWLASYHPKIGMCERCLSHEPTEYALKPGREYTRDRSNYLEACRSCHRQIDGTIHNLRGGT